MCGVAARGFHGNLKDGLKLKKALLKSRAFFEGIY
jgi:hypothetical protein